jgi:mRNA interferase RelE/StbE
MGGGDAIARPVTYRVAITPKALEMLRSITDRSIRETLLKRIDGLAHDPETQGNPLTKALKGLWSLRAFKQRYRILYRVDRDVVTVTVVAVGIRREGDRQDIYTLAQKLLRSGLLNPP